MSPFLWKRIWRRPGLALCSLLLAAVLCGMLCFLWGYRAQQETQLQEVRENFDILCVITDSKGSTASGLRMGSLYKHLLTAEGMGFAAHIRDVELTKEMGYTCMALTTEQENWLYAVNSPNCFEDLRDISLEFFKSEAAVCLVSQEVYDRLETMDITLSVTDPRAEDVTKDFPFTVVGAYPGSGTDVYLPWTPGEELMVSLSGAVSLSSARCYAADNEALDALAEAAKEWFVEADPTAVTDATKPFAFVIHDEIYRETMAALEQSIRRLSLLLPGILVLSLGLGFLVSFLASRSEGRSYALMRSLGVTRGQLLTSVLLEQLLLPALAALAAVLVTGQSLPGLLGFGCYACGAVAAGMRAVRSTPLKLLREQE